MQPTHLGMAYIWGRQDDTMGPLDRWDTLNSDDYSRYKYYLCPEHSLKSPYKIGGNYGKPWHIFIGVDIIRVDNCCARIGGHNISSKFPENIIDTCVTPALRNHGYSHNILSLLVNHKVNWLALCHTCNTELDSTLLWSCRLCTATLPTMSLLIQQGFTESPDCPIHCSEAHKAPLFLLFQANNPMWDFI